MLTIWLRFYCRGEWLQSQFFSIWELLSIPCQKNPVIPLSLVLGLRDKGSTRQRFQAAILCLYLVQQKNLFQDVVGKEQISNVAYHSWNEKKKAKMVLPPATLWCHNKQRHSLHNVSASYCVSVRSSRALFDMCSRNRFFWREWSLTRQFSTRRSDTGEWSITVNLPPLKATEKRNEAVEGKTVIRFKGVYKAADMK